MDNYSRAFVGKEKSRECMQVTRDISGLLGQIHAFALEGQIKENLLIHHATADFLSIAVHVFHHDITFGIIVAYKTI